MCKYLSLQHANLKATKLQSKRSRVVYSVSVAVYVKQRKYMFQVSSSNNPIPLRIYYFVFPYSETPKVNIAF